MNAQSVAQVLKEWYAALIARKEERIPDIRPILLHVSKNVALDFGDVSLPSTALPAVPSCCTFILNGVWCVCSFLCFIGLFVAIMW